MNKLTVFLMIAQLMIIVMVSCVQDPLRPDTIIDDPIDDPIFDTVDPVAFEPFIAQADIRLVQVGENNQELSKIAVGEDINFGQMMATESISFILTNTGNVNLFNINLNANDLIVFPGDIEELELPAGGLTISPIVSLTAEHVLPRSGVGSLLDMEVGDFTNTLLLSYQYEIIPFSHAVLNETQIVALMDSIISINDSTSDTTWAWVYGDTLLFAEMEKDTISNQLEYSVGGTRMGAIVDILFSGQQIDSFNTIKTSTELIDSPWSFIPLTSYWPIPSTYVDSSQIVNSGNVPLRIRIVSYRNYGVVLDTMLSGSDTLNTSGMLLDSDEETTGETILMGDRLDQPYIFKMAGDIILDGYAGITFGVQ